MDTVCPECNHKFVVETNVIRICYKEIAGNRAKEIKSFWKKPDEKRKKTYYKVFDFVKKEWEVDDIKSTQDVLYNLGLNETTKGDFLRVVLDSFVCLGWLKKKFQKGSKGHLYTKLSESENKECQFWIDDLNRCRLYFNLKGKYCIDNNLKDSHTSIVKKYDKKEDG